ncbi:MAG: VCBS repeat-containing protein [Candidatus Zixiibacteriota bacterium]|nr:MAG: VCBS repeat-containing protein [candidate division Zixibacteria bacterium]
MTYAIIGYIKSTLLVGLFTLALTTAAFAADQDVFAIYALEVEGKIYGYVTGDVNGDALTDVIVVYSPGDDPTTRYIGLYMQSAGSGFGLRPDYLMRLPQTAVQVDAGDSDNDGTDEIFIVDSEGVSTLRYLQATGLSKPVRIIRHKTIYAMPLFQGIIVESFMLEINGKAGLEIVIPNAKGYAIFQLGDDGNYEMLNQLSVTLLSNSREKGLSDFARPRIPTYNVTLASLHVGDCNLDGRADLYFLWDRKVSCFIQDNTGNFAQTPDVELVFYPGSTAGYFQSRLADFNGDGRPDVVVSHSSGGITNTETKVRFFICNPDGHLKSAFSKEIRLSDSHCNMIVNDFDNNNQPELVVPAVELGAIAATKMFLMKKADLHLLIYPIVGGFPDEEPTKRKKFEFKFDFDNPYPTREVTLNWMADYNGDNLRDLVFCDGNGHLQFYWGSESDYLSKKPDVEITLDHPAVMLPIHLNNGRLSDIIIEHNLTGKFDRLTVLKNRNNKM